jgi:hypothetical protein
MNVFSRISVDHLQSICVRVIRLATPPAPPRSGPCCQLTPCPGCHLCASWQHCSSPRPVQSPFLAAPYSRQVVDWAYKSSTCDVMYCRQRRHLYNGGKIEKYYLPPSTAENSNNKIMFWPCDHCMFGSFTAKPQGSKPFYTKFGYQKVQKFMKVSKI